MKRILLTTLSLFFILITGVTRAQTLAWAKPLALNDPNSFVLTKSVVVDNNGNTYAVGNLTGSADFDPGPNQALLTTSVNGQDVYIQKLDASGNLVWAKLLVGGFSYTEGNGIALDANQNVYITGTFDEQVDFDPGPGSNLITPNGMQATYILKLNTAGLFQWVKIVDGTDYTTGTTIRTDNAGNVLVGGLISGMVDLDPGQGVYIDSALGFTKSYVLKLTNSGSFAWAKTWSGGGENSVSTLDVDANNAIYISGEFSQSIDLDPGANTVNAFSNASSLDIFMVKLNATGNFQLGKSFGGSSDEDITTIRVDNGGNIILSGMFSGTADFNPGGGTNNLSSTAGSIDVFITKWDASANFLWAKEFEAPYDEENSGMDIDANGNVYVTGYFEGTGDFDPGNNVVSLTSAGAYDIFVAKLNPSGNYSFAHRLGNIDNDGGFALCVKNGSIYGSGLFLFTVDFDPTASVNTLTSTQSVQNDVYYFKWNQCTPSTFTINATGCTYTLNGQTYTGNGTYTQTLVNAMGCDSIITLNLTGSSTNTYLYPSVCGVSSYTYNGITYTSSGTYTQYHTNTAGCDSNIILQLTLGNSTFATLNETACDQYLFNGNWLTSSGIYMDTILNASGCDSIITLNLTVNQSQNTYLQVSTCGPYLYNGTTYTTSGIYPNFFMSTNGCDSIVQLDLTITPIPLTTLTQSSCTPVTINGQTFTTSGVYPIIYVSSAGCDSTVVLNLTINTPNSNVTQNGATLTSAASSGTTYQWVKCNPYQVISGATGQSYTATSNGSYAVIVTLNGCKDTSNCITLSVGTEENAFTQQFQVYPNPVENQLLITFSDKQENVYLTLRSMSGQILFREHYTQVNRLTLPTTNLSNGIYALEVSDGEHKAILKVVKE